MTGPARVVFDPVKVANDILDLSGRVQYNITSTSDKTTFFTDNSNGLVEMPALNVATTLWQPFGGHATHNIPGHGKVDNWFIKDAGYKDYYGSKSFRDIAGNLDRVAAEEGWDMSKQIVQRSGGVRKKEHGGPHDSDSTYTHIPMEDDKSR